MYGLDNCKDDDLDDDDYNYDDDDQDNDDLDDDCGNLKIHTLSVHEGVRYY